jgi:UDP-glucose 4-epimerase
LYISRELGRDTFGQGREETRQAHVEATLARAASAGLRSASLRYFNAAGADIGGEIGEAHEPETHLLPLAVDATLRLGPSLTLLGDDYPTPDGSCVRDFIHVSDLADAHLRALHWLQRAPATGLHEQFNVGSGSGYSVRQVMTETARIAGLPVPHTVGPPAWRLAPPGRQHRKVAPRARLASQA